MKRLSNTPRRSLFPDQLPTLIGTELGRSAWHEIPQALIDEFAAINGDNQWIHVDTARADRERGGTIAHAFLVLSLMSAMTREIARYEGISHGFNYGFDQLRFTSPVPCGARIRLIETLASVEHRQAGLLVRRNCVVEVENQERPAVVCDWLILLVAAA